MRSASDAFARVVAGSHRSAVRVDVLFDREVIVEGLPVVAGRVESDRTAARRSRLNLSIADPTRLPVSSSDVLTPFGFELLVWRGVHVGSVPELLPVGVFPIQQSDVDGTSLVSSISAMDRSQLVSDARFEDTYQVAAGTNYATAIADLIADGVPDIEVLFPSISFTTPLLTFDAQSDRWAAARSMASSCGMDLLFDGLGRLTMRPTPTLTQSTPDYRVAEAENMLSASVKMDRAPAYNRVIATSINAANGEVFSGVATDDDPSSPTYYYGRRFGRKPRFYASEFIASTPQAVSAAHAILNGNLGVARSVDFSAIPDPRLEVGDVVQITRSRLGLDELHIVDQLTIGLGPGDAITGRCRASQPLELAA